MFYLGQNFYTRVKYMTRMSYLLLYYYALAVHNTESSRSNEIYHFVLFSYVDAALKDWHFFNVLADIGCNGKAQLSGRWPLQIL